MSRGDIDRLGHFTISSSIGRDSVLFGRTWRHQAVPKHPFLDQHNAVWFQESGILKIRGNPIVCILGKTKHWMELGIAFHHPEQRRLFCAMIFEAKSSPVQQPDNLSQSHRREVYSVAAWCNGPR